MSGTNEANGTTDERLDQLLSLRQDGALDSREAAELEGLLSESGAAGEAARARARTFAAVDENLRRLAARTIPAARLERSLGAIERRVGAAGNGAAPRADRVSGRRRLGFGLGLAAAAAAAAFWFVFVAPSSREEATAPLATNEEAAMDEAARAESALEASGTDPAAEALASLGIEEASDLEVIDELELLDFLATRNPLPEGPRG